METSATITATMRTRVRDSTVFLRDSATPELRPRPIRPTRGRRIDEDPNEEVPPRCKSRTTLRELVGASGKNVLVTGFVANARIFPIRGSSEPESEVNDTRAAATDRSLSDVDVAADATDEHAPAHDEHAPPHENTPPRRAFERAIDCFEPARTVLFVCIVVWMAWFWRLPLLRHDRFQTFGFDLGIYDQGVWLLSQFRDPFVTVRGLDIFGHHMNVILLAIAPLYRLGGGVEVLLGVQLVAQASGAFAMFLLGRDVLRSRWCGVALAAALLLNPTYQWLMWEFFHPDAVAIGPLLFAVLGGAATTLGVVRGCGGHRARVQGRRRARDRHVGTDLGVPVALRTGAGSRTAS